MEYKYTPVKEEGRVRGPYVGAAFDPDEPKFREMLLGARRSILEIGCGVEPRLSWKLAAHDLWVGCDSAIKHQGESIPVHKGTNPISRESALVVFPDQAADIPKFY